MISQYFGHHYFNRESIASNAPDEIGVYYCGWVNTQNILETLYVGRAKGEGVTIRSRLQDHYRNDNWQDVSHFGYSTCATAKEAEDFEAAEIQKLQPKYNRR